MSRLPTYESAGSSKVLADPSTYCVQKPVSQRATWTAQLYESVSPTKWSNIFTHVRRAVLRKRYLTLDAYASEFVGTFCWVFTVCSLTHMYTIRNHESPQDFVDILDNSSRGHHRNETSTLYNFERVLGPTLNYLDTDKKRFMELSSAHRRDKTENASSPKNADVVYTSRYDIFSTSVPPCEVASSFILVSIVFGILLYVFSGVSGGHFNPAVTYAHWISSLTTSYISEGGREFSHTMAVGDAPLHSTLRMPKYFDSIRTSIYIAFQYCGAFCGGMAASGITKKSFLFSPTEPYGILGAFIAEAVGSAVLVYVMLALGCARIRKPKGTAIHNLYGAIGSLTFLGIALVCSKASSGGPSLNPALTSSVVSSYVAQHSVAVLGDRRWVAVLPYWFGPYCGATAAALLFSFSYGILPATPAPPSYLRQSAAESAAKLEVPKYSERTLQCGSATRHNTVCSEETPLLLSNGDTGAEHPLQKSCSGRSDKVGEYLAHYKTYCHSFYSADKMDTHKSVDKGVSLVC